jgi:hypothetical protein
VHDARFFVRSTFMMLSCFAVVACGVRWGVLPIAYGARLLSWTWLRFVAPATHYSSEKLRGLTSAKLCFLSQNLHSGKALLESKQLRSNYRPQHLHLQRVARNAVSRGDAGMFTQGFMMEPAKGADYSPFLKRANT